MSDTAKVNSYLDAATFSLKLAGFWPWFESNQPILKFFNRAYVYILFVNCSLITVLNGCNFLAISDGQILNVALNMITFVTYVTNFLLIVYFNTNKKWSRELVNYVNENFEFNSLQGLTNANMSKSYKLAKYVTLSYIVCGMIGGEYWAVLPLVSKGPNGTRMLPPNIWYPIDMTPSPYYELASLSFIIGQIGIASAFTGLGNFYMSSCILVCGQLDLLCCSLRNIRFTAMLRNGVSHCQLGNFAEGLIADERGIYFCGETDSKNSTINNPEDAKKIRLEDLYDHTYDSATQEALKECLRLHQMIIKYIANFENFMSPVIFGKLAQITIFLCVDMYAITFGFAFELIAYGCLSIYDLFLLCFFGNQVTLESAKVTDAAFGSPWWCCDKTVTSNLTILMLCSRPKIIQAMGFFGMTLYTFVLVLKTSFSYFTVLNKMND